MAIVFCGSKTKEIMTDLPFSRVLKVFLHLGQRLLSAAVVRHLKSTVIDHHVSLTQNRGVLLKYSPTVKIVRHIKSTAIDHHVLFTQLFQFCRIYIYKYINIYIFIYIYMYIYIYI